MSRKFRYGLSAVVLALIAAGASAPEILDQFLDEKEGNHTTAYRDGAGNGICHSYCGHCCSGLGNPLVVI